MKTLYEGMFIFPKSLSDEELEESLTKVRGEIEKAGGDVKSITRLGKRPFARPLKKQDAGHYAVLGFEIEGDRIASLHARFKLMDAVLRVQMVLGDEQVEEGVSAGKES